MVQEDESSAPKIIINNSMDEEESDLSDPQFTNSRLVEKSHEIVTAEPGTRE